MSARANPLLSFQCGREKLPACDAARVHKRNQGSSHWQTASREFVCRYRVSRRRPAVFLSDGCKRSFFVFVFPHFLPVQPVHRRSVATHTSTTTIYHEGFQASTCKRGASNCSIFLNQRQSTGFVGAFSGGACIQHHTTSRSVATNRNSTIPRNEVKGRAVLQQNINPPSNSHVSSVLVRRRTLACGGERC